MYAGRIIILALFFCAYNIYSADNKTSRSFLPSVLIHPITTLYTSIQTIRETTYTTATIIKILVLGKSPEYNPIKNNYATKGAGTLEEAIKDHIEYANNVQDDCDRKTRRFSLTSGFLATGITCLATRSFAQSCLYGAIITLCTIPMTRIIITKCSHKADIVKNREGIALQAVQKRTPRYVYTKILEKHKAGWLLTAGQKEAIRICERALSLTPPFTI